MKDFSRLAVGIILLGLAIYTSLSFEGTPVATTNSGEQANEQSSDDQQSHEPDWQAPAGANWLASNDQDESFIRPKFDTGPNIYARPMPAVTNSAPAFNQPPRISDQYQPTQPLMVSGRIQRESNLVPVLPRPSFTGTISVVRQIHTIRDGDSLQSIAREYFGSADRYLDIYLLNKDVLANPIRLPAGVEIRIPGS